MAALADARFYDDACSIKAGIENLGDIANKAEKREEDRNMAVQKEDPTKRADTYQKLEKENQENNN
jgi:hypothetical protein